MVSTGTRTGSRNGSRSGKGSGARILIYSHDSFGLGHLRRCLTIAHALVQNDPACSVVILSGSPVIGRFGFHGRVDFVRVPGVVKRSDGSYTSHSLGINVGETIAMRSAIIRETARAFDPDLLIVDKEPLGLRGELGATLKDLKKRGTPLILGLRDVMDEPSLLAPEWKRKNILPALIDLYDEIWVYGLPQICDPLAGLDMPASVHRRTVFTGYLHREIQGSPASTAVPLPEEPYLLVSPGGGGDGDALVDWVLRAYEHDMAPLLPAVIVFGPFMPQKEQAVFVRRAALLPKVETRIFDTAIERLIADAAGVVAMGGYNLFCEILSFDKRALIVPRTRPRLEQFIRAASAQKLGILSMLVDDGERSPQTMATALRRLPLQNPPSDVVVPGLLDGVESVTRLARRWIGTGIAPRRGVAVAATGTADATTAGPAAIPTSASRTGR